MDKKEMHFFGHRMEPGEIKRVKLPVGPELSLEATCIWGARPGKTLVLTAGVHGCEYVGVEALRRLEKQLDPQALTGQVILVPIANPTGFFAGAKRVVPEDGKNLNRAFPGDPSGSLSARLAWVLEQALYPAADFLADLHSGDEDEALTPLVFFPAAGDEDVNRKALEAAKVLTVPYRVRSTSKNGLYSWAVQKGVPALLIERGNRGQWSEEEVQGCLEDAGALLVHLGILPEGRIRETEQTEICQAVYQEADHQGFWYPLIQAGERICQGQLLGRLEDTRGQLLQEVRAEFDGVVLYYGVALGMRKGALLVAYGNV